jgi:hypothetical protein
MARKADNLTAISPLSRKRGDLDVSQLYGPPWLVVGIAWRVKPITSLLYADCLGPVGASTSRNPMGLHGLLQGWLYFYLLEIIKQ